MATNFLMFYNTRSAAGVTFMVGVLGVDCAAGEGKICIGSRLFLGWALDFWGSSISSDPLPSSVSSGEVFSSFFLSTLLFHCGVNQALFFWIHFLLVKMLLIRET